MAGEVTEMAPLAIDLFAGLGGWTEALLDVGYDVIGFDIECHTYGDQRYPAQLVIQDVLTLHGSQFKNAALIVASPPCQEYSYMAMPWKLAKAKAAAIRADTTGRELERLNRLFNACFRIQREASIAAGRHVPMVVENVRGAIPWVGRSRWNFGSFHLWGDVPALMPFTRLAGQHAAGCRPAPGKGARFTSSGVERAIAEGCKQGGDWFAEARKGGTGGTSASYGSKSPARKAASAMIAKIPAPLAAHIGRTYWPSRSPLSEAAQ